MSDTLETKTDRNHEDDEISLLDLCAVMVRYRKLIVIGTLVVTVLAGLWLFVVPKVFPDLSNEKAEITYTINTVAFPLRISEKLPDKKITPLYLASDQMGRLSFLVKEFKNYSVFYNDNMSEFDFNSSVQQLVSKKDFEVKTFEIGTSFDVKMNIELAKLDEATEMMQTIISDIDTTIQEYYMPVLETMRKNAETSIERSRGFASSSDMSAVQESQDLYVEVNTFLSGFSSFLTLDANPFVIPAAKGRAKKLIIIFIAALFVFICAAFCRNAVENIKKDPEASKLISDAWKAGK